MVIFGRCSGIYPAEPRDLEHGDSLLQLAESGMTPEQAWRRLMEVHAQPTFWLAFLSDVCDFRSLGVEKFSHLRQRVKGWVTKASHHADRCVLNHELCIFPLGRSLQGACFVFETGRAMVVASHDVSDTHTHIHTH